MSVLKQIQSLSSSKENALAVLVDPDSLKSESDIIDVMKLVNGCDVDFLFVGGSLITTDHTEDKLWLIKEQSQIPVILFPGSATQLSANVDALLFLSLISGRNPELLIGQHVIAAPRIKELGLETLSTGYMLVDCGNPTTASYISGTLPIPFDKPDIAAATALAGQYLNFQCLYLDGGSGAAKPISSSMIQAVSKISDLPLIVGGGIRSDVEATEAWNAGADIIVVGNAIEDDPNALIDITSAKRLARRSQT